MSQDSKQRIGQLAEELNLNPRTIRYYERLDLLPEPERTQAGYRLYGDKDRQRLGFILKAKRIGLSLDEIREILSLRDRGSNPCEHVLALVEQKIQDIDEQLRTLSALRSELLGLKKDAADSLEREGSVCHIIEGHCATHRK
jgi:MerR family Zn(II)-responsive transcriptional regulator of zntA